MTLKRDRISIEVYGASTAPGTARTGTEHADEAMITLARLIGRQIAREEFARKIAGERRPRKTHHRGNQAPGAGSSG